VAIPTFNSTIIIVTNKTCMTFGVIIAVWLNSALNRFFVGSVITLRATKHHEIFFCFLLFPYHYNLYQNMTYYYRNAYKQIQYRYLPMNISWHDERNTSCKQRVINRLWLLYKYREYIITAHVDIILSELHSIVRGSKSIVK